MPNKFSKSSKERLDTCHPALQQLFTEVLQERDITIACGYRGEADQNKAYSEGFSMLRWPQSKHNSVPSMAVDVVPYPELWSDIQAFQDLAVIVRQKAEELGIEVEWGGEWFWQDLPHWELKG